MDSSTMPSFSFGNFELGNSGASMKAFSDFKTSVTAPEANLGKSEPSLKPFSFKTSVTTSVVTEVPVVTLVSPRVTTSVVTLGNTSFLQTSSGFGTNPKTSVIKPAATVKTTGEIIQKHEQAFFEWKIPMFLEQDATVIHSPKFSFSNCAWYVKLYPKLNENCIPISLSNEDTADFTEEEDTDTVEIEHTAGAKTDSKEIIFTFAVKKSDGTLKWKELVKFYLGNTRNFEKNLCWKPLELVKQKSELLPSGELTVAFSVQKGMSYSSEERINFLESLSSNFRDLFLTKTLCDVTIRVKDAEFQAHECILIARSSLLSSELEQSENKTKVINLEDCDPYSFGDFLWYLYTGEIGEISFKTAYGLYLTADKYNVRELKLSCSSYMADNLALDNVCDVIVLANDHDETGLMASAEDYFCRNYSKIVSTSEWEELLKTNYRLANRVLKRVVSSAEED